MIMALTQIYSTNHRNFITKLDNFLAFFRDLSNDVAFVQVVTGTGAWVYPNASPRDFLILLFLVYELFESFDSVVVNLRL